MFAWFIRGAAALAFVAAVPASSQAPAYSSRVTITRDDWGIAHVRGHTDADAVFGAIYAQAEDDFPRIEANLLTALGRTAEAEGETAIWQDLRQRLWIDPAVLQADYRRSPAWLRALMDAWASGLNYYLATNPDVHPRVLTRFEPWMALSFTEGSIGGDIERADLGQLRAFYGGQPPRLASNAGQPDAEPRGSNGIAIAPRLTRDGHALLLINPHTSFFFRSELGMESDEGLHVYGASTWGQFFIYQGFNERIGWMHTSSGVDSVDEFAETIVRRGNRLSYRYGRETRPVQTQQVTLHFRRTDGSMGSRTFTTYSTHHGPIIRAEGSARRTVPVAIALAPALDAIGELIDVIDAARRVHPAGMPVETLVEEELTPGRCAIDVETLVARHLQLGAEIEARVGIDEQERSPIGGQLRRDRDSVGPARLGVGLGRRETRFLSVESRKLVQVHALDIAADTAFGKAQRHPRLEPCEDARVHIGVRRKEVV